MHTTQSLNGMQNHFSDKANSFLSSSPKVTYSSSDDGFCKVARLIDDTGAPLMTVGSKKERTKSSINQSLQNPLPFLSGNDPAY